TEADAGRDPGRRAVAGGRADHEVAAGDVAGAVPERLADLDHDRITVWVGHPAVGPVALARSDLEEQDAGPGIVPEIAPQRVVGAAGGPVERDTAEVGGGERARRPDEGGGPRPAVAVHGGDDGQRLAGDEP